MDFHDPIELHLDLGPALSVSNADAVAQLYTSILKRSADDDGLNGWVSALNGGVTLAEVRAALINSAEASATIDPLVRLYEAAFGRVPEDAGLEGWATALRSGATFLEIAQGFTGSPEFAARYPEVANGDLSGFITALYQQTLGREPEAEGLAGWIGSGLTTAEILIGFSESLEFHNRSEANVTTYLSAVGQGNTPNAVYSLFQLGTSAELTGDVIDGKVAGATIGIDVNGDGIISDDEPTLTTDALGNFSFPDGTPTGNLIATGGTDISTGLPFTGRLEAPSGSTVITPLTTVIKKLADLDTDATKTDEQKAADAQTQLKELLGLTSIGADITKVDFVVEASEGDTSGTDGLSDLEATQLYAASVQILNIVAQGSAAITGADGSVSGEAASDAVFAALAAALNNQPAGTQVDLSSSTATDDDDTNDADDFLTNVIKDAASSVLTGDALTNALAIADSAAKIAASANKEIADILNVLEALDPLDPNFGDNKTDTIIKIVQTQKVVQGEASDDLRTAAGSTDPNAAADGLADTVGNGDGSGFNDEGIITSQNIGDITGDGTDDDGTDGTDNADADGVINPDDGGTGGGGGGAAPDTTAPVITSAADFVVAENATAVATLTADETVTFEIVGGDDAAKFEVTAAGELSFIAAPDFETASDADTDNTYEVQVQATDGSGNSSSASLDIVVANVPEGGQTIQQAIDAASPGDTIHLEARTYTLTSTLNLNKGVAIVGVGEGQTILDGSGLESYGISMSADGSSLSGFTLNGPGVVGASTNDNYGIKVSPGGSRSDLIESIMIENVTVQGSLRTEIDLNGVNGAVLRNVTADGQNTGGNGISVTDSANILLENITTTGNLWGSVALYNSNTFYDQNTEDITFAGTYNAAEGTKIFAQDSNTVAGADLGTVNFNATGTGNWQVKNSEFRLPTYTDSEEFTFFFASQAEAEAYALGLNAGTTPANDTSVVISPTGEFHVFAGMSIQAAIDAATDGNTIIVHDGTFVENLTITQDNLKLLSENGAGSTIIQGDPPAGTGEAATIYLDGGTTGVQIGDTGQGFQIIGFDNASPAVERAAIYFNADHSGTIIRGNTITAKGEAGILTEYAAVVDGINIDGNTFNGVTFDDSNPVSEFSGSGFGAAQFSELNVPRQAVAINQGQNIAFTNNTVSTTVGGLDPDGGFRSNSLVTIDGIRSGGSRDLNAANNNVVSGNTFDGLQVHPDLEDTSYAVRVRGGDGTVENNTFDQTKSASILVDAANSVVQGNSFHGNDSDNSLFGSQGDDQIDGRGGADTLTYLGDRGDFTVTKTGLGTFQITDDNTTDGDEGTDTIIRVESLSFGSGPVLELDANSPDTSSFVSRFSQGFEVDTGGINVEGGTYGAIVQVASGTGGIASASGSSHAVVTQGGTVGDETGPFTRFDGYRDTFSGDGFRSAVDVYLDTSWVDGEGFDYSVAVNGSDGVHQRDFIFHIAKDASTGDLLIGGSNGTSFDPRTDLENGNHAEIQTTGWYTFEHIFYETDDNTLEVAMNVYDQSGSWVFSEIRNAAADTIPAEVGGNRYGWFTNIDIVGGVEIDNVELSGFAP